MVRHTPGCCYTSRTRYDIYRVPLVLVWYATSVGTRFYGTIIAWRRHHTIILVIVKTVKISTKTTLKITFEISYDSFADVQKSKSFASLELAIIFIWAVSSVRKWLTIKLSLVVERQRKITPHYVATSGPGTYFMTVADHHCNDDMHQCIQVGHWSLDQEWFVTASLYSALTISRMNAVLNCFSLQWYRIHRTMLCDSQFGILAAMWLWCGVTGSDMATRSDSAGNTSCGSTGADVMSCGWPSVTQRWMPQWFLCDGARHMALQHSHCSPAFDHL